uniref:Uncharacterized protein n=1 Tax=Myotis lucifugus TaxID=59463 RepID=A0A0G2LB80_MYOLU
RERAFLQRED